VTRFERNFLLTAAAAGIIGLLVWGTMMLYRVRTDPAIVWLAPHGAAQWIVLDEPISLQSKSAGKVTRGFRCEVKVPPGLTAITFAIRALRTADVRIDGQVVWTTGQVRDWKRGLEVDLGRFLPAGRHAVDIMVQNLNGPAALCVAAPAIGLATDESWTASEDGVTWKQCRRADTVTPSAYALQFDRADVGLRTHLPWLLALLAVVAGLGYARPAALRGAASRLNAGTVRWLLVGLWLVLALNNIPKLPATAGADGIQHLEYIGYLIDHHRIPLATEGWQMFQSPLYYLVSAPLFLALTKLGSITTAALWIRLVSLLCGALQIEIGFRTVRLAFPERRDLQILGTIFAGLLPMNLYLAQYVGNEPMAACFSSIVVLLCFHLLASPARPRGTRLAWLGLTFGLALLTKVSAVLLAAPIGFALAHRAVLDSADVKNALGRLLRNGAVVGALAAAVAGWYYVRNWIHLGHPYLGGWDAARGIVWWQDPGFRTAHDLTTFGGVFTRPIYAAVLSFWDGFYASFWCDSITGSGVTLPSRSPWNYGLMFASVWLALVPSVALGVGFFSAWRCTGGTATARALLLSVIALTVFGVVFIAHYLSVPLYGVVKASYSLGLMPCYVLLATQGFALLSRPARTRPLLHGAIACWAVCVYGAYFIR
jgi:hypothetical protein